MVDIRITFLSLLTDITKEEEIFLSIDKNSSVKDIIDKLILRYGKEFERTILNSPDFLSKYIILGLNGKDVRSYDGLKTIIREGDEIAFLPAIAGG